MPAKATRRTLYPNCFNRCVPTQLALGFTSSAKLNAKSNLEIGDDALGLQALLYVLFYNAFPTGPAVHCCC
jgi:hypothetical protein